jgi:deoxycytidine triphosphate deaminase
MIFPFARDRLKASSYRVAIGDRCIFWDKNGRDYDLFLRKDEPFTLEQNSIAFVTTREHFRLPFYIGARFNLRIKNVHRGLLVGTGPLVDPGFSGPLLVPLHNLTTNDYEFSEGEDFAWFEFTKVSPHTWTPGYERDPKLKGQYIPFPQTKTPSDPRKYLPRGPIRSSIPAAIAESEQSAKQAADEAGNARKQADSARGDAEKARNTVYGIGAIAVIGVIVGVGALVWSSWQLLDGVHERIIGLQSKYVELRGVVETSATSQDLDALENRMKQLQSGLGRRTEGTAREQLDAVREEVGALRAELRALKEQVGVGQSP